MTYHSDTSADVRAGSHLILDAHEAACVHCGLRLPCPEWLRIGPSEPTLEINGPVPTGIAKVADTRLMPPHSAFTSSPTPGARGPLPGGKWLVPVKDAAALLPISERTLWSEIHAHRVPHRRIRGRVLILWPDDFDQYLDAIVYPSVA